MVQLLKTCYQVRQHGFDLWDSQVMMGGLTSAASDFHTHIVAWAPLEINKFKKMITSTYSLKKSSKVQVNYFCSSICTLSTLSLVNLSFFLFSLPIVFPPLSKSLHFILMFECVYSCVFYRWEKTHASRMEGSGLFHVICWSPVISIFPSNVTISSLWWHKLTACPQHLRQLFQSSVLTKIWFYFLRIPFVVYYLTWWF